ncbi:MAG: hypothetical protein DRP13_03325 [Candidatus Aenigmatarchaeota archaeon]|nr:MAG: hypothetical protein DRP13_03325 [Candidatus Aenigmarchaeota archaeon]
MVREILYPPLIHWKSIVNGYISGSLIIGAVFNPYGIFIQILLFIIGLAVFFDTIFPLERMMYAVQICLSSIFGGVITLILSLTNQASVYMFFIFIATVLMYAKKLSSKFSHKAM